MFNKVILVGNLTRDIELRYSQGGMAIAKTGIATNRKYKKQTGEQVEEVMFIDLTFFGRSGEIANQYLRKGSKVLVEGRLILEQWTDQNGQKRSRHSINVEEMKMLDPKGANGGGSSYPQNAGSGYTPPPQGGTPYTPPPQGAAPYTPPQNVNAPSTSEPKGDAAPALPEIDIDEDEIPF